jgi:hypothetical protein
MIVRYNAERFIIHPKFPSCTVSNTLVLHDPLLLLLLLVWW